MINVLTYYNKFSLKSSDQNDKISVEEHHPYTKKLLMRYALINYTQHQQRLRTLSSYAMPNPFQLYNQYKTVLTLLL